MHSKTRARVRTNIAYALPPCITARERAYKPFCRGGCPTYVRTCSARSHENTRACLLVCVHHARTCVRTCVRTSCTYMRAYIMHVHACVHVCVHHARRLTSYLQAGICRTLTDVYLQMHTYGCILTDVYLPMYTYRRGSTPTSPWL